MINSSLIKELKSILGSENVFTKKTELVSYSYDSQPESALPGVVVHVSDKAEIVAVVKLASAHGIPLVARGAGSGMTGGSVPERGGIVLNLERMNKIIHLNVEDRMCSVQPGVVTGEIQKRAEENGLFYPPEPASAKFSTIGGNVAESAGGLGCVKYGLTRDFVAGLEYVTSCGDIVRTGVYTNRESPFNVGNLVIGSEGTLGIISEIALRLIPLPAGRVTVLALFRNLIAAAKASNAVLSSGVGPSVLEFMDDRCIHTVREYAGVDISDDAGALLIVELDGDEDALSAGEKKLINVLNEHETIELKCAKTNEDRALIWKLRKSLSPAIARIAPLKFNEDICVPISLIPDICSYVAKLAEKHVLNVVTFGHSGDGNIHVNFMTHRERHDEVARVKKSISELFREVVRIGGTLSGEHGIGISKRAYIGFALDETTIDFEKKVKKAFDPGEILNPGKIFPM